MLKVLFSFFICISLYGQSITSYNSTNENANYDDVYLIGLDKPAMGLDSIYWNAGTLSLQNLKASTLIYHSANNKFRFVDPDTVAGKYIRFASDSSGITFVSGISATNTDSLGGVYHKNYLRSNVLDTATAKIRFDAGITLPSADKLYFGDEDTYIYEPFDGTIKFYVEGADELYLNNSVLAPNTNLGLSLGGSSNKWNTIYSQYTNFDRFTFPTSAPAVNAIGAAYYNTDLFIDTDGLGTFYKVAFEENLSTSGSGTNVHWNNLTNVPTYDNYSHWTVVDDGAVNTKNIGSTEQLTFTGSTGITMALSGVSSPYTMTFTLDSDIQDLADGSLTGSKVGSGINGSNITTGTVADARIASTIARDSELYNYWVIQDESAVNEQVIDGFTLTFIGSTGLVTSYSTALNQMSLTLDADLQDLADGTLTGSKVGSGVDAANIGLGTVSNTEFGYVNGVTGAIQVQLNNRYEAGDSPTFATVTYDEIIADDILSSTDATSANIDGYGVIRFEPTGPHNFTTMTGGVNGQIIYLVHGGGTGDTVTLTETGNFYITGGSSMAMSTGDMHVARYSSNLSRWTIL